MLSFTASLFSPVYNSRRVPGSGERRLLEALQTSLQMESISLWGLGPGREGRG